MNSKAGQTLFFKACKPLKTVFTSKVDELYMFLANLKEQATTCHWNDPAHSVLNVRKNNEDHNILEDYGVLSETDVEAAYDARQAATDIRAKQNALMMHNCIYASISEEAKSKYVSTKGQLQDGPTMLYTILKGTFVATFSHFQSVRMTLQSLHLRKFNYEIVKVNEYVRLSSKAIHQGAPSGQALSNQELLFYLFNTYKRIKAPSAWTAKINFLESQAGCDATYTPTVLMDEVDKYYNDLKNNDE